MEEFIKSLVASYPVLGGVVMILGLLVVAGQVIVVATPTKADDLAWEKIKAIPFVGAIISAIANFAPIQKKP